MNAVVKRWIPYAPLLAEGDWHVHSRWSNDAEGTIPDYCRQARTNGLKLIAFTEHVRRKLLFDYAAFSEDVERAREQFPDLVILKGCEAKVMNAHGDIDAPPRVLEQCDLVIGSFHSFPDPGAYVTALENLLRNPQVDVWGHPTLYAVRNGIPLDLATVEGLIDLATEQQVLIEFNAKYRLPSDTMRAMVVDRRAKYVFGSDAHRVDALRTRKDDT
jgi:putative hydrolase